MLRLGDDFIEGLNTIFANDDRGKSFAIWRHDPNYKFKEPVELFFSLSFIIEGDVDKAVNYFNSLNISKDYNVQSSLKRKVDGYFPPTWEKVWLDSNFKNVEDEEIINLLNCSFDKKNDKNFTLKLWETMKNKLLALQKKQTLETVYDNSKSVIKSSANYLKKI